MYKNLIFALALSLLLPFSFPAHAEVQKPPKTVQIVKKGNQIIITIPSTLFEFDYSTIRPQYYSALDSVVKVANRYKHLDITIAGHTDSVGSTAYNQKLGERRANAVAKYLTDKGINPKRMVVKSYGELAPIATNETAEGRELNRRTEVLMGPLYVTEQTLSYIPHVYLTGLAGTNFTGQADVLAPTLMSANKVLFIYGQGAYGAKYESYDDNTWMGGIGLGYRQLFGEKFSNDPDQSENPRIFGGYLLANYSNSPGNHQYWTIAPGLESLGKIWDFRVNGYIPIGDKRWEHEGWAEQFGDTSFKRTFGHTLTDRRETAYEETGYGADAEVGAKLFSIRHMPVKGFVNGYYFDMQEHDNVIGGGTRLTFQPTRYLTLIGSYSYDTYHHSEIMGGLRIYLNGLQHGLKNTNVDNQDIRQRLFDPIERNLGAISYANDGMVTRETKLGPEATVSDNEWYFKPKSSGPLPRTNPNIGQDGIIEVENGTFEHPYINMEQWMLKWINDETANKQSKNARLNVEGGTNALYQPDANVNNGELSFYHDQWVFGKINNYTDPAFGANRPVFDSAFILTNGNILDSVRLINNDRAGTNFSYGISTTGNNILLNDIQIGIDPESATIGNYDTGLFADGATVSITNSTIFAKGVGVDATAIKADNNALLFLRAGNLIKSLTTNGDITNRSIGVMLLNNSFADIDGSTIIGKTVGKSKTIGLEMENDSSASAKNSNIKGINAGTGNYTTGVKVGERSGFTALGNNIFEAETNSNTNPAYGLWIAYADASATIEGANTFVASNPSGIARGIFAKEGTLNIIDRLSQKFIVSGFDAKDIEEY